MEDKDFLIYKYGRYNYALGKTLADLFQSEDSEFYIKLSVKLLHYLYFITGKFDLPRFGVYTKTRLARIAEKELGENGPRFCEVIRIIYPYLDRKLIKNCICWNILNIEGFGSNDFKLR